MGKWKFPVPYFLSHYLLLALFLFFPVSSLLFLLPWGSDLDPLEHFCGWKDFNPMVSDFLPPHSWYIEKCPPRCFRGQMELQWDGRDEEVTLYRSKCFISRNVLLDSSTINWNVMEWGRVSQMFMAIFLQASVLYFSASQCFPLCLFVWFSTLWFYDSSHPYLLLIWVSHIFPKIYKEWACQTLHSKELCTTQSWQFTSVILTSGSLTKSHVKAC